MAHSLTDFAYSPEESAPKTLPRIQESPERLLTYSAMSSESESCWL